MRLPLIVHFTVQYFLLHKRLLKHINFVGIIIHNLLRICGFCVIWEPIIWEYREWSCGVVQRQVLCVVLVFSWAGVCAYRGAGAGVVKGLKEQAVGGGGWCGNRGEGAGGGRACGLVLHERVGRLNRGGVVWLCWRGGWCLGGRCMVEGQVV